MRINLFLLSQILKVTQLCKSWVAEYTFLGGLLFFPEKTLYYLRKLTNFSNDFSNFGGCIPSNPAHPPACGPTVQMLFGFVLALRNECSRANRIATRLGIKSAIRRMHLSRHQVQIKGFVLSGIMMGCILLGSMSFCGGIKAIAINRNAKAPVIVV